jgi:hypothetical protein
MRKNIIHHCKLHFVPWYVLELIELQTLSSNSIYIALALQIKERHARTLCIVLNLSLRCHTNPKHTTINHYYALPSFFFCI